MGSSWSRAPSECPGAPGSGRRSGWPAAPGRLACSDGDRERVIDLPIAKLHREDQTGGEREAQAFSRREAREIPLRATRSCLPRWPAICPGCSSTPARSRLRSRPGSRFAMAVRRVGPCRSDGDASRSVTGRGAPGEARIEPYVALGGGGAGEVHGHGEGAHARTKSRSAPARARAPRPWWRSPIDRRTGGDRLVDRAGRREVGPSGCPRLGGADDTPRRRLHGGGDVRLLVGRRSGACGDEHHREHDRRDDASPNQDAPNLHSPEPEPCTRANHGQQPQVRFGPSSLASTSAPRAIGRRAGRLPRMLKRFETHADLISRG